jgi:16S rRNA (cytosine1402-N4)-methyltransferase
MLLEAGASVRAVDRDPEALNFARARLARFGDRFQSRHATFDSLAEEPAGELDGILLDLGISSRHVDAPERGFSFQQDGPLDMRMDPTRGDSAAELLAKATREELVVWLREYGEEPRAGAVASAIVRARAEGGLRTTGQLADLVGAVYGGKRPGGRHPATRTFQALRMVVNDELGQLDRALACAPRALRVGGRLAVISFHSLEDRRVKQFMQSRAREYEDTPLWPSSVPNPDRQFKLVTRKPVVADEAEIEENPRARSAKLRVAERWEAGTER